MAATLAKSIFFHAMTIVRRHIAGSHYPSLEKALTADNEAAREFYDIIRNFEQELDDAKRGRFRY